MSNERAVQEISKQLGLVVKESPNDLQMLYERVNDLINNDFQKLVTILYTMDVDETRLKQLLNENPGTDAGRIIASLMIERQEQKIRSRQGYKPDENIGEEERW